MRMKLPNFFEVFKRKKIHLTGINKVFSLYKDKLLKPKSGRKYLLPDTFL